MAIALTGTNGLFTRLGKILLILADTNTWQGTTLAGDVSSLYGQFTNTIGLSLIDGNDAQFNSGQLSAEGYLAYLQTVAQSVINEMVYADVPQLSNSDLGLSLAELIRQMKVSSDSVKADTIAQTVTAGSSNHGTGVCVCSTKTADGLVAEYSYPETVTLTCTSDTSNSAVTAGNEGFTATGQVAITDTLSWQYPGGSVAQLSLSAINATADNSQGNLLTNSDFETWTVSNIPDDWTIATGTAGTTVLRSSTAYRGTYSLNLHGNGSENTCVTQLFNDSSGTPGIPLYQTQYALSVWVKVDVVPAAGVLTFDLYDGSAVIADQQGTNNTYSITLSGLGNTNWNNYNITFRTPYIMPTTVKLRIRLSAALTNNRNVYIDSLGFGVTSQLYQGGPSFAVFSGATPFYHPDYFSAAITNNHGGASNLKDFQTGFQRLFNMTQLGLILPSAASPTISNGLIA